MRPQTISYIKLISRKRFPEIESTYEYYEFRKRLDISDVINFYILQDDPSLAIDCLLIDEDLGIKISIVMSVNGFYYSPELVNDPSIIEDSLEDSVLLFNKEDIIISKSPTISISVLNRNLRKVNYKFLTPNDVTKFKSVSSLGEINIKLKEYAFNVFVFNVSLNENYMLLKCGECHKNIVRHLVESIVLSII